MTNLTRWFGDGACRAASRVAVVERRDPASKSDRASLRVSQLHAGDVLWSLTDLICAALMSSQQTVARRWHRSTLTNTSFSSGEQIVSTLTLSNVCLSYTGAAHEKLSDTRAMPKVTSHHIPPPPYEADCRRM